MRKLLAILLLLVVLTYQGCSGGLQNSVNFQSISKSMGMSGGGNGEGYDGKPDPGDYYRVIPEYECGSQKENDFLAGQITVKDGKFQGEIINHNECKKVSSILPDAQIEFSPYNKDFIGYREGLYVRAKSLKDLLQNPWKYEAWCRWEKSPTEGLDVMVEVNSEDQTSRASVVTGTQEGSGLRRYNYGPVNVERTILPGVRTARYQGGGVDLNIDLSSRQRSPVGTFKAQFSAVIEGQVVKHEMNCRMAAQLDDLNFKLAFTGRSSPHAPIMDRVFQEGSSSAWVLEGSCDPQWGDVKISGSSLDAPQNSTCSADGKFSLSINYGYQGPLPHVSPYFSGSIGGQELQAEQGPVVRSTRLFKTLTSYPVELVSNASELQAISQNRLALYILTQDIDVAAAFGPTNNWTSIGGYYLANVMDCFIGVLEGNDKTITGAHMTAPNDHYAGFFGCVRSQAAIRNLHIKDFTVTATGNWSAGALTGYLRQSKVTNVTATNVQVRGPNSVGVGGLIGRNWNGDVEHISVTGQAQGNVYVGGLIGNNWAGGISNAMTSVTVIGAGSGIGGLVGYHQIGSTGSMVIKDSIASGPVSGGDQVGGLIGRMDPESIIQNTLATGSVTVAPSAHGGPLIGYYPNSDPANPEYNPNYAEAIVTSSYWMRETPCINCTPGPKNFGEAKSVSELHLRRTFQGWDFFNATWIMKDGFTLPDLYR